MRKKPSSVEIEGAPPWSIGATPGDLSARISEADVAMFARLLPRQRASVASPDHPSPGDRRRSCSLAIARSGDLGVGQLAEHPQRDRAGRLHLDGWSPLLRRRAASHPGTDLALQRLEVGRRVPRAHLTVSPRLPDTVCRLGKSIRAAPAASGVEGTLCGNWLADAHGKGGSETDPDGNVLSVVVKPAGLSGLPPRRTRARYRHARGARRGRTRPPAADAAGRDSGLIEPLEPAVKRSRSTIMRTAMPTIETCRTA